MGEKFDIEVGEILKDMDDFTVTAIQNHLNENYERDIRISKEFADDHKYDERSFQQFDTSKDDYAKEGKREWMGEFARQQDIIFEMNRKQLALEEQLEEVRKIMKENKMDEQMRDFNEKSQMGMDDWLKQDKATNTEILKNN